MDIINTLFTVTGAVIIGIILGFIIAGIIGVVVLGIIRIRNRDNYTEKDLNRVYTLIPTIIVVVIGALLMAEAIVNIVTGEVLFFYDINRGLEFTIGFVFVLLAGYLMPKK
ncbi:MAG: hypothetical protein LLF83_00360 [Methanobacterium sp.]|nr:hypothetical protein [Methanobacterium sp.]